MTCQELVELVTAFLDGALDPRTERRFIEHLAVCAQCEPYLEQFRRTIRALGELPPEGLPDHVRNDLLRAFRDWPAGEENG